MVLPGAGQLLGWASALVFIWVLLASGRLDLGPAGPSGGLMDAPPRALGRIRPDRVPSLGWCRGVSWPGGRLWVTGDGQYFSP